MGDGAGLISPQREGTREKSWRADCRSGGGGGSDVVSRRGLGLRTGWPGSGGGGNWWSSQGRRIAGGGGEAGRQTKQWWWWELILRRAGHASEWTRGAEGGCVWAKCPRGAVDRWREARTGRAVGENSLRPKADRGGDCQHWFSWIRNDIEESLSVTAWLWPWFILLRRIRLSWILWFWFLRSPSFIRTFWFILLRRIRVSWILFLLVGRIRVSWILFLLVGRIRVSWILFLLLGRIRVSWIVWFWFLRSPNLSLPERHQMNLSDEQVLHWGECEAPRTYVQIWRWSKLACFQFVRTSKSGNGHWQTGSTVCPVSSTASFEAKSTDAR